MKFNVEAVRSNWPIPTLTALWIVMCLVIWPVGEFAINDDWGFSTPVRWLSEYGVLQFTHWQAMTLLTQVLIGAVWTFIFGFSQLNLRILVMILAAAALVVAYLFARESGLSKKTSFAASALFLASPIFSATSTSFMTDTPYLFFVLIAALFLVRSVGEDKTWTANFFIGAFFLVAAILLRQTGVAVAMAAILAEIVTHGVRRKTLLRSAALIVLSVGALAAYGWAFGDLTNNGAQLSGRNEGMREFIVDALHLRFEAVNYFFATAFWGIVYAGFFMSPIAVVLAAFNIAQAPQRLKETAILFLIALLCFAALVLTGRDFPRGNILTVEGIGPLLIASTSHAADAVRQFSIPLAAVASLGAAILAMSVANGVWEFWKNRRGGVDRARLGRAVAIIALAVLTYLPYCVYYGAWFDRYLFSTAYFAFIAAAFLTPQLDHEIARRIKVISAAIALGIFASALLVHDYFVWSRARYGLIEWVHKDQGTALHDIDGGFEFVNNQAFLTAPIDNPPTNLVDVSDRTYLIAKTPFDEYSVIDSIELRQILLNRSSTIYVLKKNRPTVTRPAETE